MRQESGGIGEVSLQSGPYGSVVRTRPPVAVVHEMPPAQSQALSTSSQANALLGSQSSVGRYHANHIEAQSRAASLSHYVQNVENETHAITEDNARLKAQLLAERRATLQKYFRADDQLLKQMIFGEWKVRLETARREKRLVHADNFRKAQRAKFTNTIQELERALLSAHHEKQVAQDQLADTQRAAEELTRKLDQSHQRRAQLREGLAGEEYFLAFLKGCLDRRAKQLNPQAFKNLSPAEVVALKDLIHSALIRIDPYFKPRPVHPVLVKEVWERVEPPTLLQQVSAQVVPAVEAKPVTCVTVDARLVSETPPVPPLQMSQQLHPQQRPLQQLPPQLQPQLSQSQLRQQGHNSQQVTGVCTVPAGAAASTAPHRMRSGSPEHLANISRQGTPLGQRVLRR